ncbi:unnamed protein product [Nyctereutes procyonoides]|uniref:(raccoon dog) hypothetical protein n=1 Tax=Nyctereutes procyonoides TaxID=34880 RepID=A0A811YBY2_NYCPR|nr:unnamed protein product [Nyctereutes procyonoides]
MELESRFAPQSWPSLTPGLPGSQDLSPEDGGSLTPAFSHQPPSQATPLQLQLDYPSPLAATTGASTGDTRMAAKGQDGSLEGEPPHSRLQSFPQASLATACPLALRQGHLPPLSTGLGLFSPTVLLLCPRSTVSIHLVQPELEAGHTRVPSAPLPASCSGTPCSRAQGLRAPSLPTGKDPCHRRPNVKSTHCESAGKYKIIRITYNTTFKYSH